MAAFPAIELLIAAFAGGAFGAALGALPAFIFTGFMVIAGEASNLALAAVGEAQSVDPTSLGTVTVTGAVAFGPMFSPAVAFGGGVAGTAYAARRGYMESGFDYHNAKDILFALGTRPDVLAVGGVFGIIGYLIQFYAAAGQLGLPLDPIALGVTVSALLVRLTFGYSIIGSYEGSILDMGPFEREEMRTPSEGAAAADGGVEGERLKVEPWLPHQYKWPNVATLGFVLGIIGAFIALETGSTFLAFGISAASLVFLNCGVERIPVTHHMSLMGSAAAVAVSASGSAVFANAGMPLALIIGGVFGLICGLFAELFQRVFYAHGDTHWDPPAAAIVFGTLLIAVLYYAGIFAGSSYVPV